MQRVILATGIYPPAIGGPATYSRALAEQFFNTNIDVVVVTYGAKSVSDPWPVITVSTSGGPFLRWYRYAKALRSASRNADVIYTFSSVSCGVPLWLSGIRGPKKILRLGGSFFWERYTATGGRLSLREWTCRGSRLLVRCVYQWILHTFDHIVFSTKWQQEIYEQHYRRLPPHSVIENALPIGDPVLHAKHDPLKLLFMGRFVGFKNVESLLNAIASMRDHVTLTIVGSGPLEQKYRALVDGLHLQDCIAFQSSVHGDEKKKIFAKHDALILPSITEISPNVALEARAHGLPVLLSRETGLSKNLTQGMMVCDLISVEDIRKGIEALINSYDDLSQMAATPTTRRGWDRVALETLDFFHPHHFDVLCENNTHTSLRRESIEWVKSNKQFLIDTFAFDKYYHPANDPLSFFMAGSPGAGKTETSLALTRSIHEQNLFVVRIDPDEIRSYIPQYNGSNTDEVKDASFLAVEKLYDHVLEKSKNFILDSTFTPYEKVEKNIERAIYKKRLVHIIYVHQDPIVSWEFTKSREVVEGRSVPKKFFIRAFFESKENVQRIKEKYKNTVIVHIVAKDYKSGAHEFYEDVQCIDDFVSTEYTKHDLFELLT